MIGCSSLTLTTKDNRNFVARTMDFSLDPGSGVLVIPRGEELILSQAGNRIQQQYAIVGMGTKQPPMTLYDGVNEKGVAGAVLYYRGEAVYEQSAEAGKEAVNPLCALLYMLGNCKSLEEVKDLSDKMTLIDEGNDILGHAPPLHFIFTDPKGETLIMEPDKAGMSYYEKNVGVLTNSPAYPWHETNLRNFIGVNPYPTEPVAMNGKLLTPFGQASGTWSLPGDYTGPSRFVRTAYLKTYARQGENELDGLNQCMHILSAVNIPEGVVITPDGHIDFTRYTSAICAESRTYYFHTYDCRRINAVTLTDEACKGAGITCYDWPESADVLYLNN